YKARIKILVKAMGVEAFTAAVEKEWEQLRDGPTTLPDAEIGRIAAFFSAPPYASVDTAAEAAVLEAHCASEPIFANWVRRNSHAHQAPGYRAVTVSLKATGNPPGDISAAQLDRLADLCEAYSFGQLRTTHQQNVVLADVRESDLLPLWRGLQAVGLACPNAGYLTDMICCPGGDFCSLANAKSIPVAEAIQARFEDLDYLYDLGPLELNISGCMNACG
ncbi:MAG TPA: sulfite reductase, partial [Halieaceae bacterium]|nr:sulfite reductase [Halieaceae bacterium]